MRGVRVTPDRMPKAGFEQTSVFWYFFFRTYRRRTWSVLVTGADTCVAFKSIPFVVIIVINPAVAHVLVGVVIGAGRWTVGFGWKEIFEKVHNHKWRWRTGITEWFVFWIEPTGVATNARGTTPWANRITFVCVIGRIAWSSRIRENIFQQQTGSKLTYRHTVRALTVDKEQKNACSFVKESRQSDILLNTQLFQKMKYFIRTRKFLVNESEANAYDKKSDYKRKQKLNSAGNGC